MKILIIVGTRPEAIKMAPVIRQMQCYPDKMQVILCSTGQHRDMLDQALRIFGLAPDIDLNLMQKNQTPSQVAARVLLALDAMLDDIKPDWMLVQGDTTTVMAASIAAHHRHVRVGHVEAGLRSHDFANPFPEEMNRVVTDHVSDLHFTPTVRGRSNLLAEGIAIQKIFVTGNTVIDAMLSVVNQPLDEQLRTELHKLGLEHKDEDFGKHLILVTAHRRENHGRPIRHICQALRLLAIRRPNIHIVYPVHRNPNIWEPVHEILGDVPGVTLIPPVDYRMIIHLMMRSRLILTDSGGIQEEAPSLGVPVLVLRATTERPEAVEAGVVKVIGTDPDYLRSEVGRLLDDNTARASMARVVNPYGDGQAAVRIVDVLLNGNCQEFDYTYKQ